MERVENWTGLASSRAAGLQPFPLLQLQRAFFPHLHRLPKHVQGVQSQGFKKRDEFRYSQLLLPFFDQHDFRIIPLETGREPPLIQAGVEPGSFS